MKQILQSLKDGTTRLEDVPAPRAGRGQVLIHTSASLVSAGTERMLVEFGKAGWIDKARQQPEKVRQVAAFVEAMRQGAPSPIPLADVIEVSQASIEIANAARL